jgi:hypothetical protein
VKYRTLEPAITPAFDADCLPRLSPAQLEFVSNCHVGLFADCGARQQLLARAQPAGSPRMLEWVHGRNKAQSDAGDDPAAGLPSGLRGADPDTTLNQLSNWLTPTARTADPDPKARSAILARVEEEGTAHVAALLSRYLASPAGRRDARESTWKSLLRYQTSLTQGLCTSAEVLTGLAITDRGLRPQAAMSAARALAACRRLAKICLVHYASVPRNLWRLAYLVHRRAESAGCAMIPVKAHADQRSLVTAEQELLRLLMLQVSAPDMMAPEHIEVADRAVEQVGEHFTLRPPGVADNPFCFDPEGTAPPWRANEPPAMTGSKARYFGPGMGFDALQRIHKQLTAARHDGVRIFGADIPLGAQLTAIQHLLMFWRAKAPYVPPQHSQATGDLQILHRYAQIWTQLSSNGCNAGGLSLAVADDRANSVPEHWVLRDIGGNELGVEIPEAHGDWAKCGEMVSLSMHGRSEYWVGMIRRMQAEPGSSRRADIAVLSRKPLAVPLRAVRGKDDDGALSDAASRLFAFDEVRAIVLADGAKGSPPPNLLLPPEAWKEGRVFEAQFEPTPCFVRGLEVVRRGEDYVRATFEWVSGPLA